MTVEASPDWLPPGWTRDFRIQKTGRCIMQYVNRATGQKFFTKDDLVRYTKMESKQFDDNSLTLRQITKPSANSQVIHEVNSSGTAVKENEHPEWLPKNWLVEVKTRKSGITIGKQIKIYIDPSTGLTFYSKPQVLRFLNRAQQINGNHNQEKRASRFRKEPAVNANERPEWLPENWLMEVKTIKSGLTIGRQVKIYVDPSTGSKFYSVPQALRFLNHADQRKKNHKQKKRASCSRKEIVIEKSTVDDLPSGWIKEVKIKRTAYGVRKYACYTDPARGYVFLSKKAVHRYLETGELAEGVFLPKKCKDNQILTSTDESVVIETSKDDDLPSGWIKEVKNKRSANGVRTYVYYTDPASRHVFRSKKAVHRYLKTGEIAKGLFLMEKNDDDQILTDADESQLPGPASKRQKLKHLANRQLSIAGGETSDRSVSSDLETETFEKGRSHKDCAETGLATSSIRQMPQRKGSVENAFEMNPETTKLSSQSCSVACEASNKKQGKIVSADNVLVSSVEGDETEKRSSMKSEDSGKSKNKKELDLLLGVSNQLDQLEPEKVQRGLEHVKCCQNEAIEDEDVLGKQPQMLESEGTRDTKSESTTNIVRDEVPCEDAPDGLVSTPASSVLQEKNLGKTRKERKRSNTGTKNSSKSKKIKELDLPHLFSKQLAGLKTELVADGVSTKVAIQSTTRKSEENKTKPPCVLVDKASAETAIPEINNSSPDEGITILEEQPQLSGTQKGSDNKSELEPLFCSDPCLEFAIKTLTGAIPLEDAIIKGLVSTPVTKIQQQNTLAETRTEHSRCRKTLFNSTISRDGLHQQSSKRVAGEVLELVANSLSNEQILYIAARKLDMTSEELREKSSQQLEIGPRMAYGTTLSHDKSLDKSKEPRDNQTVPSQTNNENPGQLPPTWSSWSYPCFKSPFRTVACSSPVEASFDFRTNSSQQQFGRDRTFALPDHGLPNVSQNGIPSYIGRLGQPVLQQQFSSNPPSMPPPGNVSLPSSNMKGKRNHKTM